MGRPYFGLIRAAPAAGALVALGVASGLRASDCDRNGKDDREDLAEGAEDCNANGVPDRCDVLPQGYIVTPIEFPSYKSPGEAIAADLDGDGRTDLASANDTRMVSVLWNDGDLHMTAYVTHGGSDAIAAGDLDGDRDIDILSAGDGSLSLVRNLGGRSFALAPDGGPVFPVRPSSLVLVDIDADGDLDAVAAGGSDITFLGNDGSGSFAVSGHILAGDGPLAIFPVDIDRDGDRDFVTGNRLGSFTVWPDLGGRAPGVPVNHESGKTNAAFAMADLDGDGDADICAVNYDGTLRVHRNQVNGEFTNDAYPLPGEPTAVRAADLDGDGDVDLAVADALLPLRVFRNHGDGSFVEPVNTGAAGGATSLLVVDIDADGVLDIAAPDRKREVFGILEGRIGPDSSDCDSNGIPDECDVRSSDCNGNGVPDPCDLRESLDCDANGVPDPCDPDCTGNGVPDACDIASGRALDCNGNGVPDPCDVVPSGFAFSTEGTPDISFRSMATGDFRARGELDLIVGVQRGVAILARKLPDNAYTPVGFSNLGSESSAVATGDLDGDGLTDATCVTGAGVFAALRNGGAYHLELIQEIPLDGGSVADALVLTDLDGDSDLDAVAGFPVAILSFMNDGLGAFSRGTQASVPRSHGSLWSGDLDGDGLPELAAADAGTGQLLVVPNEGGLLAASRTLAMPGISGAIAGGDADGDGDMDLMVSRASPGRLSVLLNDGAGALREGFTRELAASPSWVRSADIDRDGRIDLALALEEPIPSAGPEARAGRVRVLLGRGDGSFDEAIALDVANGIRAIDFVLGDVDGNGSQDLVLGGGFDCEECPWITEAILLFRNASMPPSSRDGERDGIPDECQGRATFRRGDVEADARLDLTDPLAILDHLFRGAPEPGCREAADADNDGSLRITDAIYLLGHLFLGAPPPPEPGPPPGPCGPDTDPMGSAGDLGCASYPGCP